MLPSKHYDVIYADPPWSYAEVPYFKKSLAIQYKYPTLKKNDLFTLDVERIAKKDCWLFMWAVWAQLPQALKVMEAWGFSYRTCAFVWAKKTKHGKNAKTYGRCCTQGSTEVILCGKRGSPKRYAQNVPQFLEAKTRGNSIKPDEVYSLIDKVVDPACQVANIKDNKCSGETMADCPNYCDGCWCHIAGAPDVKKVELFARRPWEGWDCTGNDRNLIRIQKQMENPSRVYFGDIREMVGVKNVETIDA